MGYSLKEFHISIPDELIAQYPSSERQESRLLVLNIKNKKIVDDHFYNIKKYIFSNDCIIYNDVRVINARLYGIKSSTDARLEILLTRRLGNYDWRCLIRPARRVKTGIEISLKKNYSLKVIEEHGEGFFTVRFSNPVNYEDLTQIGEIPLPKYIKRKPKRSFDEIRYQTIYSEKYGAVAAPTAGLHFTDAIIRELKRQGTLFVPITLYVDWATFKPVRKKDFRDHIIHSEQFEISEHSAQLINHSREMGRRIICVGTTSVRTVETAIDCNGRIKAGKGETNLYIYPGYEFKCVEGMITNFHMPDSTLILLVAAFAGKENIKKAYNHAITYRYRFFSYGDAMYLYNRPQ